MSTILLTALSLLFWQSVPMPGPGRAATGGGGGGTSPVFSRACSGGTNCTWIASSPTAGSAVVGVVWISTTNSVVSVCDGTGATGCTGSSTYTINTKYNNASNFASVSFYTCSYAGTADNITITLTAGGSVYSNGISATGNSTTACSDGYNQAQSTSAGTAYQSATITTTNAQSLLVGLFANGCGGTYTAGTDGQGHTYTLRASNSGVTGAETLGALSTGTYYAAATGPNCVWNAAVMGVK